MRAIPGKIKQGFVTYKTPIIYASSSIIKAVATLITGFIIAKFISPKDFGLWTTLSLFVSYALIFQGGMINGLSLELPLALGKGNVKRGNLLAGVTQTVTFFSTLILLFLGLSAFFLYPFQSEKEKFGFLGIVIITIFTFYQNYLLATFRSNNQFLKLSYIQIIEALLNFVTIILVFYYTFYGMVLKACLVIFIFVLILAIHRPIKVGMNWNKNVFKHLMKIGMPIFALAYLEMFALTFDKVLLLHYTDISTVGIYSFAFYAFAFSTLFSTSIASYIYPKLTFKYGETGNKKILWKYVKKITLLLITVQLPFAFAGIYFIPIMIESYFPNYVESTLPMQILLFAGVMKGSVIGANVLWSIKKWKYMIVFQVTYAVLFISLTFLFINMFQSKIIGVSVGVFLANLINLLNGIYLSYKATNEKLC